MARLIPIKHNLRNTHIGFHLLLLCKSRITSSNKKVTRLSKHCPKQRREKRVEEKGMKKFVNRYMKKIDLKMAAVITTPAPPPTTKRPPHKKKRRAHRNQRARIGKKGQRTAEEPWRRRPEPRMG